MLFFSKNFGIKRIMILWQNAQNKTTIAQNMMKCLVKQQTEWVVIQLLALKLWGVENIFVSAGRLNFFGVLRATLL